MYQFNDDFKYTGRMDKKVIPLCNALNSLPGIETFESCCGHSCSSFMIWFVVRETDKGLFFLTRCVDHRYWKYGYLWNIKLEVGDSWYKGHHRPVHYLLTSSPIVGIDAYRQADSLLKNMLTHLNDEVFLDMYELSINDFKTRLV